MRIGPPGEERPAVLDEHANPRDLSGVIGDITPEWLGGEGLRRLTDLDLAQLPMAAPNQRMGAPISRTGKIVCVGLNYSDHAAETGQEVPKEPILFLKAGHTLQGPNDEVRIPRGSVKTDWEVELGVVIGCRALYVREVDALAHVAGYCLCNDVSERAYQLERGGTWDKGKNCDTFGPVGPWLVTPNEVADPQQLDYGWTSMGAASRMRTHRDHGVRGSLLGALH